jgi:hypothetical protein
MRKSWAQSSFTESPTTERNAEYIAAESTVGSSIQRGSIGPSMECRLIVKLAEPGFDSATKLAIIEARRRKTAGLSQSKAKQTAGPRGDPVRTPQGPMGTPCGPMETPWGPMGGAMGTHGDPMGTNGRAMGTQGDPWGPWGGGGGGEGPLTPIPLWAVVVYYWWNGCQCLGVRNS